MKIKSVKILIAVGIFAFANNAIAATSTTYIPASQTFLFGGDQGKIINISGCNIGKTNVSVQSEADRKSVEIIKLKPSECFKYTLPLGVTAKFVNLDDNEQASMSFEFNESPNNVGMRYINSKTKAPVN